MIYAIKNRKVDRAIYKENEDALTSSIFERLMYLPQELVQQILKSALSDITLDLDFNKLESIEYWPNWDAKADDISNKVRVQPDVFIRTKKYDIIIEVKRHDRNSQLHNQWANELKSYFDEYADNQKEVVFIALGGLYNKTNEVISIRDKKITVYKCYWSAILEAVKALSYRMQIIKTMTSQNRAICAVLEDIILSFSLFGFSTADWLERLPKSTHIKGTSLKTLQNFKQQWKN